MSDKQGMLFGSPLVIHPPLGRVIKNRHIFLSDLAEYVVPFDGIPLTNAQRDMLIDLSRDRRGDLIRRFTAGIIRRYYDSQSKD